MGIDYTVGIMMDERYAAILKRTVNEQDQEIMELNTRITILENRIHELEGQNAFIDHYTKDIPLGDIHAIPEEKIR